MRTRTKVILLAVLPLVASLLLIALAIRHQEADLAQREHVLVERTYMEARRAELRHYVELALSTIKPLLDRDTGAQPDPTKREQALRMLASLDYGADGYFFVYDLDGTVLMHSRQPELIGKNLWEMRDANGRATIQDLINKARAGGGYVDYLWRKPSSGQTAPKLGYVVALERWNWMVGTGLYMDDITSTVHRLDEQARQNIETTLLWIAGIAAFGVALISISGLLLNLSEYRVADAKLRLLARQVVQSQEDERAHLARELHDGTSQTLVSTKLMIESAVEELRAGLSRSQPQSESPSLPLPATLSSALSRLNDALTEVRGISHRLRPAVLDTLGLPAALEHLAGEMNDLGRTHVGARVQGQAQALPDVVNTVLFRVTQEALTNIAKHAQAANVEIELAFEADGSVRLTVRDDGKGFDLPAVQLDPRRGIGLRNMRERVGGIGGRFEVQSSPSHGTQIEAVVPDDALARLRKMDAMSNTGAST